MTSLTQSLAYTLGRIEARAVQALAKARYSDVITDERDDLAAALREIQAMARDATAWPSEPTPAGVEMAAVGTRHPQDPNEGVSDAP